MGTISVLFGLGACLRKRYSKFLDRRGMALFISPSSSFPISKGHCHMRSYGPSHCRNRLAGATRGVDEVHAAGNCRQAADLTPDTATRYEWKRGCPEWNAFLTPRATRAGIIGLLAKISGQFVLEALERLASWLELRGYQFKRPIQTNPDAAAARRELQRGHNGQRKRNASREISAPVPTQARLICHFIW